MTFKEYILRLVRTALEAAASGDQIEPHFKKIAESSLEDGIKVIEDIKGRIYNLNHKWFHLKYSSNSGWNLSINEGFFTLPIARSLKKSGVESCEDLKEVLNAEVRADFVTRKGKKRITLTSIIYASIPLKDIMDSDLIDIRSSEARKKQKLSSKIIEAFKKDRNLDLNLSLEELEKIIKGETKEEPKDIKESKKIDKEVSEKSKNNKSSEDKKDIEKGLEKETDNKEELEEESLAVDISKFKIEEETSSNIKSLVERLKNEPEILPKDTEFIQEEVCHSAPKSVIEIKSKKKKKKKKRKAPLRYSLDGKPLYFFSQPFKDVLKHSYFYQRSDKLAAQPVSDFEILEALFPGRKLSNCSRFDNLLYSACLFIHKDSSGCDKSVSTLWNPDFLKKSRTVKRMIDRAILFCPTPPALVTSVYDLDSELRNQIIHKIISKGWVDPRIVAGKLSLIRSGNPKYKIVMESLRASLAAVCCLLEYYSDDTQIQDLLLNKIDSILKVMILRHDAKPNAEFIVKTALMSVKLLPDGKDFEERMKLRFKDPSGFKF